MDIRNSKVLPLGEPLITTFPSYAATLGILSKYPKAYDWIYSHYIQLCTIEIVKVEDRPNAFGYIPIFFVDTDTRRFTNLFSDNLFIMRTDCPYFYVYEIPFTLIDASYEGFVSMIKASIDLDMYLKKYIETQLASNGHIVVELFHGLLDHKSMMIKRVEHFIDNGYMSSAKLSLLTELEEIKNSALIIRNHIIKYRIQNNPDSLDVVLSRLDDMKEREVQLLKRVFDL